MVCNRCILAVGNILNQLGLSFSSLQLGEVQLITEPNSEEYQKLQVALENLGFEIIDDKKNKLIEKIKTTIIGLVHWAEEQPRSNMSDYIAEKLHYDYNYLSNIFSEREGITIEKYFIAQKIERVKELLLYGELSLSEIAYKLGYSSVAHLSNQFKKVTGLTPSYFKEIGAEKRKPIDKVNN